MNGNTTILSNAGDADTLRWYDEDGHPGTSWRITASASLGATCDIKTKENIKYFKDIYNMNSLKENFAKVKFCKWNKKCKKERLVADCSRCEHYGIIAQEFEPLFPEFIENDKQTNLKFFSRTSFEVICQHILQNLVQENIEYKVKIEEMDKINNKKNSIIISFLTIVLNYYLLI